MKPFFKWVGGKSQILDHIVPLFPTHMENYHEPFLGGGSVLFRVLEKVNAGELHIRHRICAYDINDTLIHVYKNIQSPETYRFVREYLVQRQNEFHSIPIGKKRVRTDPPPTQQDAFQSRENYYYWVRTYYNEMTDAQRHSPEGSSLFLFLNKAGFRGVYREGPRGFNVPYGNPTQVRFDLDHLDQVHAWIAPVHFQCCSFSHVKALVGPGDFVYMDPPYSPETATSFVKYNVDGFTLDTHMQLFEWFRELVQSGIAVVMSNSDTPMVHEHCSIQGVRTTSISCRRAIHSKNPGSQTAEVILAANVSDALV
jgi:DNA adenine methylase